jgi:CheY-like chemotaxis protein
MESEFPKQELKVLHVDDDAVDAMNLQRVFKKLNVKHEVKHVNNGKEALTLMRDEPRYLPNVILLDLNMPILGGFEFLEALRMDADLQHVSVFVLSSSDHSADIENAYGLHVAGYFLKPLSPAKYNLVIKRLVEIWAVSEFPVVRR